MKVSAAAVLASLSTASAFNVGYLNQLGGAPAPAKAAPLPNAVVASGHGYLDNLNGTPELVSAIEAAPAAPAPVAPAPVAPAAYVAPAPAAVVSNGGPYLSALAGASTQTNGGGLTGYLDALPPSGSAPTRGPGIITYIDAMGGGGIGPVVAATAPAAAAAAPVAVAVAAPVGAAPVGAAPIGDNIAAVTSYLGTLAVASAPLAGAGISTFADFLPSGSTPINGGGLSGYLDILHTEATQTSGAGLTGYLDALKSSAAVASNLGAAPAAASPSVTSFLESVYSQILALPEGNGKTTSGASVSYTASSGSFAMQFVKN
mmetsp:Transcript_4461/g.4188  ORF Transcript_4461/g.4188 Transcript_4461/m.4188 type:complete len:317 (+) Transcript_4461:31-981(+)